MKKIILLILALLLLQFTMAQETPNVTFFYNLSESLFSMGNCDSDGVDTLVCTYPTGDTHLWEYGIFNTTTGNLTLVDVPLIWRSNSQTSAKDVATCHYYTNSFYCPVTLATNDSFGIVELSGDYTTYNLISTHPNGIGDSETRVNTGACDLKPGTDEIYCWSNIAVNPVYNNIWKYDIGDNNWTMLKNVPVPLWQSPGISEFLSNSGCTFRPNTDELWCYGGGEFNTNNFNYNLTIYDVGLNTTTTIQNNGFDFIGGQGIASSPVFCRWHFDVLYCYGIVDESLSAQNDMWYYNATSDSQGWIVDIIPAQLGGRGSIGDKDYLISGLEDDVGTEKFEVFEIEWSDSTPCIEDWQPYYTACTIGDNQTLLYTDTNACGTYGSLPGDNGTVSSCNYCSPIWQETSPECVTGESEREITYDYTNSCCEDTGLPTDCNIPANTTESCIGIHSSLDIGRVFIDFSVEIGIALIALASILVIGGVYIFLKNRV